MKRFLLITILVLFCFYIYAKYINVNGISVKEYEIKNEKIIKEFDGFKIVHFSDVLYKDKNGINELKLAIKNINEQNPDMIVFTGDLIKYAPKNTQDIVDILKNINADYKYAILGDNDKEESIKILENSGFTILNNNYEYIFNKNNSPLKIIDGNSFNEEMLNNEENISPFYNIVLTHKPDNFSDLKNYDIDLVLAGHSLGGQIRIPFWGALLKKNGAKIYTDDYYNENNSLLYVSFGIGTEKTPLRTFNKPSINVYRLLTK